MQKEAHRPQRSSQQRLYQERGTIGRVVHNNQRRYLAGNMSHPSPSQTQEHWQVGPLRLELQVRTPALSKRHHATFSQTQADTLYLGDSPCTEPITNSTVRTVSGFYRKKISPLTRAFPFLPLEDFSSWVAFGSAIEVAPGACNLP